MFRNLENIKKEDIFKFQLINEMIGEELNSGE